MPEEAQSLDTPPPPIHPHGSVASQDPIIHEKSAARPVLAEGESLRFSANHGFPPVTTLALILCTFFPAFWFVGSFLWGPVLLFLLWNQKKHGGVWITDTRLICFTKRLLGSSFELTVVPLREISEVRHARGGGFGSLIDRLFGVGDLQLFVQDSKWTRLRINEVKAPGELLRQIQHMVTPGLSV